MSEISELIQELRMLPDGIKNKQTELLKLTTTANLLVREISSIEAEIAGQVAKDESLTNDTRRKAATRELLDAREDYKTKVKSKIEIDMAVRITQIDLDFLRDQFRACQSIALVQAPKSIQVNLGGL